jgi:hypothetical protein
MPELIDGAVVASVCSPCGYKAGECEICQEQMVYIHNWLVETELKYLIVDLQDEKDICAGFLQSVLHLKKRLRVPFLFAGVVEKPREILQRYNYSEFPIFVSPEDAVRALRVHYPGLTERALDKIEFGKAIVGARARAAAEEAELEDEDEDD